MSHKYPIGASIDLHGVERVEIRHKHSGSTHWSEFRFKGFDGSTVSVNAFGDRANPLVEIVQWHPSIDLSKVAIEEDEDA